MPHKEKKEEIWPLAYWIYTLSFLTLFSLCSLSRWLFLPAKILDARDQARGSLCTAALRNSYQVLLRPDHASQASGL